MTTKNLTRKQQAFIDYWLGHPKASGTEAALATYGTKNSVVAASIAYENLRKPQILAELRSFGELAEGVIVGTIRDWGRSNAPRKREIALNAAKYAHDKIHGKATVKLDQQSQQIVKIAINLTGDGEQAPEGTFHEAIS